MQLSCMIFAIIAATSLALAGVIGITDRLEGSIAVVATAAPISGLPTKSVRCGGNLPRNETFDVKQIRAAAEAALNHLAAGTQVGNANKFPKPYGYRDPTVHFPDALCSHNAALTEFPITRGLFNGGDVTNLAHRVIIKREGKKAVYCGLITHEGAPPAKGVNAPYTSCSG